MSECEGITLACLDLAGTTVSDGGVTTAYAEALATMGIVSGTAAFDAALSTIQKLCGRPKSDIFHRVFPRDDGLAGAAELAFDRSYNAILDRVGLAPIQGAETTLDKLSGAGIRICAITGFGNRTISRTLDILDWWHRIDLTVGAEDSPRGRPHPDPILTAALRVQVEDVRQIAVCADTHSALLAAHRAGASTIVGVLTGAHDADQLRDAGATHIIDTIADLPDIVLTPRRLDPTPAGSRL